MKGIAGLPLREWRQTMAGRKGRMDDRSRKLTEIRGRRRRFYWLLFFACCLFGSFVQAGRVEASSASVTVETKNDKVEVGDTVYVIVTVRSMKAIKGFEGYFTYDNRYLRFESGGSVVHGNDDAFQILDMERAAGSTKLKYSVKFTARKAGGSMISLKKPYNVLEDDGNNSKMSVSYSEQYIKIDEKSGQQSQQTNTPPAATKKPKSKKKADKPTQSPEKKDGEPSDRDVLGSSKLRSLEIRGIQLTPEFSPDIEKYSGVISTSKEELPLAYEPEDSHATIKVSGNKNIKDGKNVIKISVRNSAGEKTTYRLSVTVQKITPEEDSENSRVNVVERSGKFYVVGTTTICAGEADAESIPDGYARVSMEVGGKNITCYAPEGDSQADYVLIYGEEEKAFYLYDRDADALFPYEKVRMWYLNRGEQEISTSAALEQKIESYQYVLAIMGVFSALMLLMMLYFALHSRR